MKDDKEIAAMKTPITLAKLGIYAFASALLTFLISMLTHLLGVSKSPTTIEQFVVMYVLNLVLSIVVDFYRSRRKRSPAPTGDDLNNGNVK